MRWISQKVFKEQGKRSSPNGVKGGIRMIELSENTANTTSSILWHFYTLTGMIMALQTACTHHRTHPSANFEEM